MEQENAWKGRSSEEAWHLHHLMDLREVSCYVGPGTRHLNSVLRWTALPLTPPPKTLRSLAYEHVLNFVGRLAFLAPFADITLFLWGPQDFSWRGLTTQTHISQTQSSAPWILRHLFSFVLYSPAPGHWALPGLCPAPLEAPTCVPQTRQAPRVWQSALPTLTFASAALAHTAPPPPPPASAMSRSLLTNYCVLHIHDAGEFQGSKKLIFCIFQFVLPLGGLPEPHWGRSYVPSSGRQPARGRRGQYVPVLGFCTNSPLKVNNEP